MVKVSDKKPKLKWKSIFLCNKFCNNLLKSNGFNALNLRALAPFSMADKAAIFAVSSVVISIVLQILKVFFVAGTNTFSKLSEW